MASILLQKCEDEFQNLSKTKSLVEDIYELRREKLHRMMKNINPETTVKFLNNIGAVEVNNCRAAIPPAYQIITKMNSLTE